MTAIRTVVRRFLPRHLVAAFLVYLPFQGIISTNVNTSLGYVIRYGPKLVVVLAAVTLVVRHRHRVRRRLEPLALPLGVLLIFWTITGLWNWLSWETLASGMRSDFRFLPLLAVVVVADKPLDDARLYGRVLIALAAIESELALAETAGLSSTLTTFEQHNLLGAFLALAAIMLAAAGPAALGLSRWVGISLGALIVAGIFASGSREGGVAFVVGVIVVGLIRLPRRAKLIVLAVAVVVVVGLALPTMTGRGTNKLNSSSTVERWQSLFGAEYSPGNSMRTRLLVGNAKLVARGDPIFGFGIGSGSDPGLIKNLTSPVYRSFPKDDLANSIEPFVYDSYWATVILETGFVGLFLLLCLFCYLGTMAVGIIRSHWCGAALLGTGAAAAALGFAAPALRESAVSAVLWLLTGLVSTAVAVLVSADASERSGLFWGGPGGVRAVCKLARTTLATARMDGELR